MTESAENLEARKELILQKRDEGKVVYLAFDGTAYSSPVNEFIDQPADGILYDLNRLEEIALTFMDDPKWVNDFAVALTIRALKKERDALLAVVRIVQNTHSFKWDIDRALAALPEHLRNEA